MTRCWWSVVPILAFAVAMGDCRTVRAQFGSPPDRDLRRSPKTVPPALMAAVPSEHVLPVQGGRSPEAALLVRANWDCVDTPLKDWLRTVRQRCGIPVYVAETHLQDAGIGIDTPVSLEIGEALLLVALPLVLEPQGLDFDVSHGVLVIDTIENLELQLSTRVYPVLDLVQGDWQSLMFAIQQHTSGMWEQVDGEGGTMTPVPATGSLVISQTWKVHRQIHSLLAALRQAAQLPDVGSIGATPLPDDNFDSLPLVPVTSRPKRPAVPAAAWQIPRLYDELQPKPVKRMPVGSGPGF